MLKKFLIPISIIFVLMLIATASYTVQPSADFKGGTYTSLFQTSHNCQACHNALQTKDGTDVSIGFNWRGSIMANSSRDPYWHAAVRREVMDHPESGELIEDECAACHMPMARYDAAVQGKKGVVFANVASKIRTTLMNRLSADGVSCAICHQIEAKNLGEPSSFTGGFQVQRAPDGQQQVYGPYVIDPGRSMIMQSATGFIPQQALHTQKSEVCATCHTLITNSLGQGGQVTGRLHEQVPYQEWLHSSYKDQSCQSCHMPVVSESVAITSVLGQPRPEFSRHIFTGGNFFMLRMLNRYRDDLAVEAPPEELETSASRTLQFLQTQSASLTVTNVEVDKNLLKAEITIRNLAGHKLPTAYPSRRVWIQFTIFDSAGKPLFESGAIQNGSIAGNDNDADPARYEPHYRTVDSPDKVQIYETIMIDPDGAVTTGLLAATQFVKDNRLLPHGFDPKTASEDIAVRGEAAADPDFGPGGDIVRYQIALQPNQHPSRIQAKLWYQPIGYRWAQNFRKYNAAETIRFVSYYDSMAAESAVVLAEVEMEIPQKTIARIKK